MRRRASRSVLAAVVGVLLLLPTSGTIVAQSELVRSTPPDGAVVPPFLTEPVVLEFSAPLGEGSKADMLVLAKPDAENPSASGFVPFATATVDAPNATMTIELPGPIGSGSFRVEWTSVATDGQARTGAVEFTVAAAGSSDAPDPSAAANASVTSESESPPSEASTLTTTPSDSEPAAGSSNVALPIIVALVLIGAAAAYVWSRRNRSASTRSR